MIPLTVLDLITDFIFWKRSDSTFTGYARRGFETLRRAVIKGPNVFIEVTKGGEKKLKRVGYFKRYDRPIKIRADKIYDCIGEIRIGDYTYHLLDYGKYYRAI